MPQYKEDSAFGDNWERALEIFNSGSPGWDNEFATLCIPMAKRMAKSNAAKFRNPQLDEAAFFSAAMDGLESIIHNHAHYKFDSPYKLRDLCSNAFSNHIKDLKRHVIGVGKDKHPGSISLDEKAIQIASNDAQHHACGGGPRSFQSEVDLADLNNYLDARLSDILDPEQYRVMSAVIKRRPEGYTMQEIASELDKNFHTMDNIVQRSRKKICTYYPELVQQLEELLIVSRDRSDNSKAR